MPFGGDNSKLGAKQIRLRGECVSLTQQQVPRCCQLIKRQVSALVRYPDDKKNLYFVFMVCLAIGLCYVVYYESETERGPERSRKINTQAT